MITENSFRFLKPPTIEQIDAVVKKAGVTPRQFERFHGIYPGCIAHIRAGLSNMPSKHWHLFLTEKDMRKHMMPAPPNKPTKEKTVVTKKTHVISKLISK